MRASDGMRTGGEILADQLVIHGVRHVFCVPGESYIAALDGMYGGPIELTVCRQEGGASMMAEAIGKATGRPGICFVTRGPGATNAAAGLHIARQDFDADDPVRRAGRARHARARGVPGARLPRGVRLDRQMGDRDRRSRAHPRAGLARLLHRDQRPPGSGGDRAAGGHAGGARQRGGRAGIRADRDLAGRGRDRPHAAIAGRRRAADRHRRRQPLVGSGERRADAVCRALRHSGRDLVPPHPCHGSAAPELCRRPRQRSQSQAAGARESRRPRPVAGRQARRMAVAELQPARRPGAEADAHPCASGHRGARPRLPADARDPQHADRLCRRARSARRAERHSLARRNQDRACRLPGVLREADRGAGAGESWARSSSACATCCRTTPS